MLCCCALCMCVNFHHNYCKQKIIHSIFQFSFSYPLKTQIVKDKYLFCKQKSEMFSFEVRYGTGAWLREEMQQHVIPGGEQGYRVMLSWIAFCFKVITKEQEVNK